MNSNVGKAMAAAVAIAAAVPGMAGAQSWLCAAEQSTGFRYVDGGWRPAGFDVADQRFVIRRGERGAAWEVVGADSGRPSAWCEADFNEAGYLNCSGWQEFRFNRRNGRFVGSYMQGYVDAGDAASDGAVAVEERGTPAIVLGRCARIVASRAAEDTGTLARPRP